jgi:hypothetical protein
LTYVRYHDTNEEADAVQFLDGVRGPLLARLGTAALAQAHGYVQMTNLRPDGTVIYFDRTFGDVEPLHPNFLWFDRHDRLVGMDYEFPVNAWHQPPGKNLFPVRRSRWTIVPAHVHVAYRVGGVTTLAEGEMQPNLLGDNVADDTLVRDGLIPADAHLLWFSYQPRCWDLGLWLIPNPLGAFADYNPNVYL